MPPECTRSQAWRGPGINLQVSAPGYYAASQPVTLQRGPNEMAVILERDPLALAAADACATNEKRLYAEDFQSGQAADWRLTTGSADWWSVVTLADGNKALSISGVGITQLEDAGLLIDNAVVRLMVQTTGKDGDSFINFKHFRAGGDTRYIFQWGANPFLFLTRFDGAKGEELKLRGSDFRAEAGPVVLPGNQQLPGRPPSVGRRKESDGGSGPDAAAHGRAQPGDAHQC